MNDMLEAFLVSLRSYLKFIPIILIPVAGLLFMISVAPYYAVNSGCRAFGDRQTKQNTQQRRELALLFSLSISTLITVILVILSYSLMAIFALRNAEITIITAIYGSFMVFSLLGAR